MGKIYFRLRHTSPHYIDSSLAAYKKANKTLSALKDYNDIDLKLHLIKMSFI